MSVFEQIDKDQLIKAIEKDSILDAETLADAKSCVYILAKKYGDRDFEELEITAVEKPFTVDNLIAGTCDLIGTIRKPKFLPADSIGKKIVFDWKTTAKQDFDTKWKNNYINSWQWKIYSWATADDYFEYRGISRTSGETKEILLKVDVVKNHLSVSKYLQNVEHMRRVLQGMDPYPRHMPYACNAYNRECPFLEDCLSDKLVRILDYKEPLHYTSIETFLLCPERYRREALLEQEFGRDKVGSESTRFGTAVHNGMQNFYTQLMELQKNEKRN